ncbi:hypothetical protein CKA52_32520, partial [Pseudomonas aeruginosa]
MGDRLAVPIRYYALAGIAALVAGGLAWWFARAQRRWPTWGERLRLVALYGGVLGVLY